MNAPEAPWRIHLQAPVSFDNRYSRALTALSTGGRRDSIEMPSNQQRVAPMASKPATKAKTAAAPKTAAKNPGKPALAAAKKPAAKAVPKKVAETVTLKTVFEQLAAGHDLSKKLAQSLLTDFVASVTSILKNGDRVRMSAWVSSR
jgi:hypothetical protein